MEIPADVCQHGHPLAPGSEPITIQTEGPDGKVKSEMKLLRRHQALIPGAYRSTERVEGQLARTENEYVGPTLTMAELSPFDPTGLVPVPCAHGLPAHPDPRVEEKRYGGQSWIRGKYATFAGKSRTVVCPVCLGEPRPDDLTTPANA